MAGLIVVSGFGPWGTLPHNPTLAVLDRLDADPRWQGRLVTLRLPVESAGIAASVRATLAAHDPAAWIGLGLPLGAAVIAVERVAVNLQDFAEPDIAGAQPAGRLIVDGGPAAYLATLPGRALRDRLRGAGIPARLSDSAGAFLCNQLLYTVLHQAAEGRRAVRAGFLHIPADPALVARLDGPAALYPSMNVDLVAEAVALVLGEVTAA